MNVTLMTKKQFMEVPTKWMHDAEFDSFIIIPTNEMHDSGFRIMHIVLCNNDEPVVRMAGSIDSVRLDGICGKGKECKSGQRFKGYWQFDCLKCGYIRMWCNHKMTCGMAVSDFEIFREVADGNNSYLY